MVPAGLLLLRGKVAWPALATFVLGYGLITQPVRERLAEVERHTIRGVTGFVAEDAPTALRCTFGTSAKHVQTYDPRALVVGSVEDLEEMEALARSGGRPLLVFFSGEETARARDPDLVARVIDGGGYDLLETFPAMESMYTYRVFAYAKPGK